VISVCVDSQLPPFSAHPIIRHPSPIILLVIYFPLLFFAIIQNGPQKQGLSLFSSETSRERELFECWHELDLRWVVGLG
jgi:hypothetical protein